MKMPIDHIRIGPRRREDLGDLKSLAESIRRFGVIHPIVVDQDGTLVAGERRLRACEWLGYEIIEVRCYGDLTEAERAEIELEENLHRKDLTPYERAKTMVQLVATARQLAQAHKDKELSMAPDDFRTEAARKSRGRPLEPGSYRDLAQRTGIPVATIRDAEQHVAAVERYPELAPMPQADALTIAKNLDRLPEAEQAQKREALRRYDPQVLAELAEKPPLPPGPSMHQQVDANPERRWYESLHRLYVLINSVHRLGGMRQLAASWSATYRQHSADELRDVIALLQAIQDDLDALGTEERHGIPAGQDA